MERPRIQAQIDVVRSMVARYPNPQGSGGSCASKTNDGVVVLASLIPIMWETGVGADVMKPIAAAIVCGMITSTIHVLIVVPVFFALMKERALRRGALQPREAYSGTE
jgi:hypothetical protein